MKKLLILCLSVICILGCSHPSQDRFASIKGEVVGKTEAAEIQLMTVKNGVPVEYAGTSISSNGSFAFLFEPDSMAGYYYLYDGSNYYRLSVQSGNSIKVSLTNGLFSVQTAGNTNNKYLIEWNNILKGLDTDPKELVYADFFPRFDKVKKQAKEWLAKLNHTDVKTAGEMQEIVQLDLLNSFISFLCHNQKQYESEEQQSVYYQEIIKKFPIQGKSVLKQPYGIKLLQNYFYYKQTYLIRNREYTLEECLNEINDTTIKAEYLLTNAPLNNFDDFIKFEDRYMLQLPNDSYRKRFRHLKGRPVSSMRVGEKAPNFIYPDTAGTYHSLSSLKGKYKYIDIWATWCVPCKKELPALQKLEKEFKGKDIAFISISIDKNKKKWLDFVQDKQLGGLQLRAGDWSELPAELELGSVPRFLIIDPDGNWIDTNALRPSNPELWKQLKSLLKNETN